jgi:hypothetical protein
MQATGMAVEVVVQDSLVIQGHLPTSRGKGAMACTSATYLATTGAIKAGFQAEEEADLIQRRITMVEVLALPAGLEEVAEEDQTKEAPLRDEALMVCLKQEEVEDLVARVMELLQEMERRVLCLYDLRT